MSSAESCPKPSEDGPENRPNHWFRAPFRSSREIAALIACIFGMSIVGAYLNEPGWSWATTNAIRIAIAASLLLAWLTWFKWGRLRFPMPEQEVESSPPRRRLSKRAHNAYWAFTAATYGLMFFVARLDWPRSTRLWCWYAIIGIHAVVTLISWIVHRRKTQVSGSPHGES